MSEEAPWEDAGGSLAVRGQLALGGRLVPGLIRIEDGQITAIETGLSAMTRAGEFVEAAIVAPGLIDLQVNGGYGVEVGYDREAFAHLARELPRTGITSFLPTLISSPEDRYRDVFVAFDHQRASPGARMLGLHLEGPFLSPARRGAHPLAAVEAASDLVFEQMLANPDVALVTVAPELPGNLERIRLLAEAGIVVSLGHTDAGYEEILAGTNAGATMATHLFNAMSPFGHRAPGAIGTVLVEDRLAVGLILDGVHCHPAAIELALRAKGLDRIVLVTDMMSAAGMGPGEYTLGGRAVSVDDTSARLEDGTLAGSILTMDQAIRNLVHWGLLPPAQAIRLATENPARVVGQDEMGRIAVGAAGDLTLFDADLSVVATVVDGRVVYRRDAE